MKLFPPRIHMQCTIGLDSFAQRHCITFMNYKYLSLGRIEREKKGLLISFSGSDKFALTFSGIGMAGRWRDSTSQRSQSLTEKKST